MAKHRLNIKGMTCEGCAAAVAEALRGVPGARSVQVRRAEDLAVVEVSMAANALLEAVKCAGYTASLPDDVSEQ
jgi:copper chaperone CopZ